MVKGETYRMMSEIDCDKCRWQNNCQNDCVGFEPIVEQTNEEWFCGLSTEEKAEFLIKAIKMCKACASGIGADEVKHCPIGECGCHFKDEVIKWLKEKRNDNI